MRMYIKVANWALYSTFGPVVSVAVMLAIAIPLGIALARVNTMQITYEVEGVHLHQTEWAGRFGENPVETARQYGSQPSAWPTFFGRHAQRVVQIEYCPRSRLGIACETIWPQQ